MEHQAHTLPTLPTTPIGSHLFAAKDFTDAERDRPRGKMQVLLEVVVRAGIGLWQAPGHVGQLLSAGTHTITVYEDDVAAFFAQVEESPETIAAAERAYELVLAGEVQRRMGTERSPADLLLLMAGQFYDKHGVGPFGAEDKLKAAFQEVRESTSHSVQGRFFETNQRSSSPLLAVRVVGDERFPEPQRKAKDEEARRQIGMVAETVRALNGAPGAGAPAGGVDLVALQELITKQAQQLEQRDAQLATQDEKLKDLNQRVEKLTNAKR